MFGKNYLTFIATIKSQDKTEYNTVSAMVTNMQMICAVIRYSKTWTNVCSVGSVVKHTKADHSLSKRYVLSEVHEGPAKTQKLCLYRLGREISHGLCTTYCYI